MQFTPKHREPLLNAIQTSLEKGETRDEFLVRCLNILRGHSAETVAAMSQVFHSEILRDPLTQEEATSFRRLFKALTRETRRRKE